MKYEWFSVEQVANADPPRIRFKDFQGRELAVEAITDDAVERFVRISLSTW